MPLGTCQSFQEYICGLPRRTPSDLSSRPWAEKGEQGPITGPATEEIYESSNFSGLLLSVVSSYQPEAVPEASRN